MKVTLINWWMIWKRMMLSISTSKFLVAETSSGDYNFHRWACFRYLVILILQIVLTSQDVWMYSQENMTAVSLKTDLRCPITGQEGHGNQIIHVLHKNAHYPFGDFFQRFHKTPSGILVNGSVLKELFANNLGVFEAYGRNKLYIHLYALSWIIHLFVRLWNIFRIGWMNCHHALFTEKSV